MDVLQVVNSERRIVMKEPYEKPMVVDEVMFVARSGACQSLAASVYHSDDPSKTCYAGSNCSYSQGFPSQSETGTNGNRGGN